MISEYMKCELFGVCGFGYIGCFGGSPDGLRSPGRKREGLEAGQLAVGYRPGSLFLGRMGVV